MNVRYKTFFTTVTVDKEKNKEQLKRAYHAMVDGANNVPTPERPKWYYDHFIICGISFEEFLKVIQEEEEK